MRPRPVERRGFKLIEVMAIIFIVAIAYGLFLPSVQEARGPNRRAQCQNNMRQLGLAMLYFSASRNRFPNAGTIYDNPSIHGGDPAMSNIDRAIVDPDLFDDRNYPLLSNWVVELLPYLDQTDLANAWDPSRPFDWDKPQGAGQPPNCVISSTGLGVLRCPSDPTTLQGQGNLSYAVNGGFARWYPIPVSWSGGSKDGTSRNGEALRLTPDHDFKKNMAIGKKLGVLFLGTQTGDQPWDMKTSLSDITDGASNTLLIGENTLVGYSQDSPYAGGLETNWACPLPNFVLFLGSDDICRSARSPSDCLGGQLQRLKDGRDGPGWARANQRGTFEEINYGQNLSIEGSFPFANSGHPGGANFVFCDGAVRFLSSTIDGTLYAKLITPAGGKLPRVSTGMFQVISDDDYSQ
jgi:prepilin-type processing-associated H-X9-DG protein